jgi:hypothetical protein
MTFIVEQTTVEDEDEYVSPVKRPSTVFGTFLVKACWWAFWVWISVLTLKWNPLFNIHFIDTLTPLGIVVATASFLWLCWASAQEYVEREKAQLAADAAA